MSAQTQAYRGLHFYMMGPLTIFHSELGVIESLNRKESALLCYLKVNGRSCSRRELEVLLWPDAAKPQVSLRVAINHLRRAGIDHFLDISDEAMAFNQQNHWSDVDALQYQLEQFVENPQTDLSALLHLVDQSDDEFLPEFSQGISQDFHEWRENQQLKIQKFLITILESLMIKFNAEGDVATAIRYAKRLKKITPWHRNAQAYLESARNSRSQQEQARKHQIDTKAPTLLPAHSDSVIEKKHISLLEAKELFEKQTNQVLIKNLHEEVAELWILLNKNAMALSMVMRVMGERPFLTLDTLNQYLLDLLEEFSDDSELELKTAVYLCIQTIKPSAKDLLQKIVAQAPFHFTLAELTNMLQQDMFTIQDTADYLVQFDLLHKIDGAQYRLDKTLSRIIKEFLDE